MRDHGGPGPIYLKAAEGVGLRIRTDGLRAPDAAFPLLAAAYVPGAQVADRLGRMDGDIEHREADMPWAEATPSSVRIRDAWGGRIGDDAYHLLHAMARAAWLGRGLYSAHAACVEIRPGEGVLLTGPSGCGKTAVALDMLRQPGARMLSGNKTLLDLTGGEAMQAVAGTLAVTASAADVPRLPVPLLDQAAYGSRVAGWLPPALMASGPARIRRIVFPRLRSGPGSSASVTRLSALHRLHPVLLDAMNADVVLAGGKATYVDGCPPEARKALAPLLAAALRDIEVLEAAGEPSFVAAAASA